MLQYKQKVEQKQWGDGQVVVRELLARDFQELEQKHGDSQGLDFVADLAFRAMVEPAFASVAEAKEALLSVPPRGVKELAHIIVGVAGLGEKNAG